MFCDSDKLRIKHSAVYSMVGVAGLFMVTNPKMIYTTLRWICVLFFIPIGYIAVILTYRGWIVGQASAWGTVFRQTSKMVKGMNIFSVLWIIAMCLVFLYRWHERSDWCRKLDDNVPMEDEKTTLEIFHKVRRQLGLPYMEMPINRNVFTPTPIIIGLAHPQIVLPERDYTEAELELIFYHELAHYKHKDLFLKGFVVIVMMVHCFNPCVYLLSIAVNYWSECMADATALEASGNLHNAHAYFDNIMELIPYETVSKKDKFFFSTLNNNKEVLNRRVDFMKKYQKFSKTNGIVTATMTAAFIFMTTSTAFASGKAVADLHNMIYRNTEEHVNETEVSALEVSVPVAEAGAVPADESDTELEGEKLVIADDGMVEHWCRVEDLDLDGLQIISTPNKDSVSYAKGVHYNFDWIVDPNTRYVTANYAMNKGQYVSVSAVVTPRTKDFWIGIMREGVIHYVEGRGAASHNFKVDKTDDYCVFVQNNYRDGTKLNATGYFVYAD